MRTSEPPNPWLTEENAAAQYGGATTSRAHTAVKMPCGFRVFLGEARPGEWFGAFSV